MAHRAVQVAIRTRPTASFAQDQVLIDQEARTVAIRGSAGEGATGAPSNRQDSHSFKFHHLLHLASQDTCFDLCLEPIASCVAGSNATIMAYGQTGAGKTFTMIGDTRNFKFRGIAPRAIAQVFADISERPESSFQVKVSYMEIYNDRIFDLLAPPTDKGEFQIVQDKTRGMVVRGLSEHAVDDEEMALNMLFQGEVNRTTAEHLLNKQSNRSHCIFTMHLTQRSRLGGGAKVLVSKLHLVDLAGSERIKKTLQDSRTAGVSADDIIMKESMYINKSLSYLEQVVVATTTKSRGHIPYRQTKLTHILKDAIGGNCRTILIACVWAEGRHMEETISTLRFAARMMRVRNETSVNVEMDPAMLVKKYEKEIRELKQELAMHDALADRSGVVYDEYTPEQQAALASEVRAFLKDETDADGTPVTIEIESVRKMQETLRQVKIFVRSMETEIEEKLRTKYTLSEKGMGGAGAGSGFGAGGGAGGDTDGKDEDGMVGELEGTGTFAMGMAPAEARPRTGYQAGSPGRSSPSRLGGRESKMEESLVPKDKNKAFSLYKAEIAPEDAEAIRTQKSVVKSSRATLREHARAVNDIKADIDTAQAALDSKRGSAAKPSAGASAGDDDEVVVDEEEYRLMKALSDAKKAYKAEFGRLREAKAAVADQSNTLDELAANLVAGFGAWWEENAPVEARGGPEFDESGDALDVGEAFERLEMERVAAEDPDSLAYFHAHKKFQSSLRAPAGKRSMRRR